MMVNNLQGIFIMKNKLNEASIKVDVQGLESSDFETLSRMLALAGQAESEGGMNPGFSDLPKMEPLDLDGFGDETQPIMEPTDVEPSFEPGGEPELGLEDGGMGELDSAVDDLAGTVTDFGADAESDDLSLDLDGEPALELDSEVQDDFGDDEFDMGRMSSLAGISESLESDEDEAADEEVEEDNELEDAEEDAVNESLLPDLSLDEDAEACNESGGEQDSKEHGPFRSEKEAVHDAMRVTNGTEFEHFAIIPGKDGYYWRRNIQEELDNEPDPSVVDMSGVENSQHSYQRQPGTALGNNGLRESEDSSTEDDDEEDVEDILESISSRYDAYIKGL